MTIDSDMDKADARVARKNAVRLADKSARCHCCGETEPYRRLAALWKAAFVMQDSAISDIAWEFEKSMATGTGRKDCSE